ncbi:lipocalin family protein [Sungkyunkwania multivorans]|uniref:Lipocalin family protein n=1 Tax=Sungkyunkwania multivorans TaxID=1173618 RepID=A0ABW3CZ17_9FLAO
MRKVHLIYLAIFSMVAASCSVPKFAREVRQTVNGSWTLTDISYDQPGRYETVLFNDADAKCFVGSDWFFRNNNSTGTYTISSKNNCASGIRYIRWSVNEKEEGKAQLQFKLTDERKKDVSSGGYLLNISSLNSETMVLDHSVMVGGNPLKISYTFKRTNS